MKLTLQGLLIFCFLVGCTGHKLALDDFIITKDKLPENCELKSINLGEHLPCQAKTNPFISSDRAFISCFASGFISDTSLISGVKRALFSVYENDTEFGIFALEAETKKIATSLFENIDQGNLVNSKLYQSDFIIVLLWSDSKKDASFEQMKDLIAERVQ